MPTYDYRCSVCGSEFEVSKPVSRMDDAVACPSDGQPAQRVLSLNPATFGLGRREVAGDPPPSLPGARGWSHAGHSHGFEESGHAHDLPVPPSED